MTFNFTRGVDPSRFKASVEFTAEEIDKPMEDGSVEDKALFFELYGPDFAGKPVSEQLSLLSQLALLNEQAAGLGLAAGTAETK